MRAEQRHRIEELIRRQAWLASWVRVSSASLATSFCCTVCTCSFTYNQWHHPDWHTGVVDVPSA